MRYPLVDCSLPCALAPLQPRHLGTPNLGLKLNVRLRGAWEAASHNMDLKLNRTSVKHSTWCIFTIKGLDHDFEPSFGKMFPWLQALKFWSGP